MWTQDGLIQIALEKVFFTEIFAEAMAYPLPFTTPIPAVTEIFNAPLAPTLCHPALLPSLNLSSDFLKIHRK
jgi:hypothetical protein